MSKKNSPQRKLLLVNPKMQLKYILLIVICFFIVSVLLGWDYFFYLKDTIPQASPELKKELIGTFIFITAKVIALTVVLAFFGLLLSNQIAGPVYRLSQDIIALAENADLTVRFNLRERDEVKEVADALNHMVALFRNRLVKDDEFREKVRITASAMIHLLKNKKNISYSEKEKLIKAGTILLKESSKSPTIRFKL